MLVKTGMRAASTCRSHGPILTTGGVTARPPADFGGHCAQWHKAQPFIVAKSWPRLEAGGWCKGILSSCLSCWAAQRALLVLAVGGILWLWQKVLGNPFCPPPLLHRVEACLLCRGAAQQHYATQSPETFTFLLGERPPARDGEAQRCFRPCPVHSEPSLSKPRVCGRDGREW